MAVPEEARRDVFSRIKKDISAQALSEWFLNWITSLTLCFHWRALRNRGKRSNSTRKNVLTSGGRQGRRAMLLASALSSCLTRSSIRFSVVMMPAMAHGCLMKMWDATWLKYYIRHLYVLKQLCYVSTNTSTLHKRRHYGIVNLWLKWKSIISIYVIFNILSKSKFHTKLIQNIKSLYLFIININYIFLLWILSFNIYSSFIFCTLSIFSFLKLEHIRT